MKGIEYATDYKLVLKVENKKEWYDYIIDLWRYIFDKLTPLKK